MTPEQIAASLSEAQKRAVLDASFEEGDGAWHPSGHYVRADKRVRYSLCRAGITGDYLRVSNPLTPLGMQVRAILEQDVGKSDMSDFCRSEGSRREN